MFTLIWSTKLIFWLNILNAIVAEHFIVFIHERIILLLYSQAFLWAKNEVNLIFYT